MIRRLLCGLALTAAISATGFPPHAQDASAQELKEITFLANYSFNGRHSPFFVGLEKGFYEEAGFDISIKPAKGSGFVVSAIDSEQADYGMAESSSVVQALAKGSEAKGFMVFMDVTTSGLASLEPYPTPESLQGAKIAASPTDSARVILPIIFDQKGLDPSTINWVAADPGVYISLLMSGQVDLFTAAIDSDWLNLMEVVSRQGKEAYFSSFPEWGYDVFGYFLITQSDRIAEHPDQVEAFADATTKAVQYSIDHPDEAARIMVEHNPTLDYDITLAQWTQSIKTIETDYVQKHGYGVATPDRVQRTIDLVKQAADLDAAIDPNDAFAFDIVAE